MKYVPRMKYDDANISAILERIYRFKEAFTIWKVKNKNQKTTQQSNAECTV